MGFAYLLHRQLIAFRFPVGADIICPHPRRANDWRILSPLQPQHFNMNPKKNEADTNSTSLHQPRGALEKQCRNDETKRLILFARKHTKAHRAVSYAHKIKPPARFTAAPFCAVLFTQVKTAYRITNL